MPRDHDSKKRKKSLDKIMKSVAQIYDIKRPRKSVTKERIDNFFWTFSTFNQSTDCGKMVGQVQANIQPNDHETLRGSKCSARSRWEI